MAATSGLLTFRKRTACPKGRLILLMTAVLFLVLLSVEESVPDVLKLILEPRNG
jgi:hypothetical protein